MHVALRSGDKAARLTSQKELGLLVTKCKEDYKTKVEANFKGNKRSCWKGIKTISGYRKDRVADPNGAETEWAEKLNLFNALCS